MSHLVKTTYLNRLMLTNAIDPSMTPPATALSAAKIACFSDIINTTPAAAWADLTESVFSGYAKSAVVAFGSPVNETDGSVTTLSPSKQFTLATASPVVTGSVKGVALVDSSTPPKLLAFTVFDTEVNLVDVGDGFSVVIAINEGDSGANNEVIVIR